MNYLRISGLTVITVVLLNLMTGCITAPVTGRSQFIMTSEQSEMTMGNDAWNEMLTKAEISNDAKMNSALQRVGNNIAKVADKPEYQWQFKVFVAQEPNAFCLPGGKVGVTTALFKYTANDAELATVVGHEIAHAIARHSGERMTHGVVQEIGGEAVKASTENEGWHQAYNVLAQVGAALPYSRTQEYEADYIGLILMAKAGYDPAAALTFWRKFSELSQTGQIGEIFSTHPMGEKRLAELKELYTKAAEVYRNAPVKHGLGVKY